MILRDRLGGKGLPFIGALRRHDHPLPERLPATGRVEQVRSRDRERSRVHGRIGELEDHPGAGEPEHDSAGSLHARHTEHLRGATSGVPGSDRVDDVLVAIAVLHNGQSAVA